VTLDDRWIQAAQAAAQAARAAITPWYRAAVPTHVKEAASPIVTEADLAAERAMRTVLATHTPEAGVLGEELGHDRPELDWQWVLDPIDGTIAFAAGKPTFATLIGLLHEGRPVLGLIDQPITRERWLGVRGRPTTHDGVPVRTREVAVAQVRFATTSPWMFDRPGDQAFLAWVREAAHVTSWGGDAYNYGLVASGGLDLVVERGLALHDWAALVCVIEGAGGRMTDWSGAPLAPGATDVVAAASEAVLEAALTQLTA
jgi:histidinol phosphatase-like enzyme (inositol monophosphatase family)